MRKIFIILFVIAIVPPVFAKPNYNDNKKIRTEMRALLSTFRKLDIAVAKEEKANYSKNVIEGHQILKHIDTIRTLDTEKKLKKDLAKLESRVEKMVKDAELKNPKTSKDVEKVLETCMNCHASHQGPW